MNQQGNLYRFEGLPGPVLLKNCDDLLPILRAVLRDWDINRITAKQEREPLIEIELTPEGYRRSSQWLNKESCFKNPVDAACDFIVDLIHAYLSDRPELLCLHCAAVEFPEGLVLFPNTYRSGKSTLAMKLVSRGLRLFSDDVLPLSVTDRLGMALGILPRLRIPLPETADDHFRSYIDRHSGPLNNRYLYSDLDTTGLAYLGERAPVRAITVLERSDGADATIEEAGKGEILKDVILRNFARQGTALNILDTLYALVEQCDCYTLRYDNLEEATDLLISEFGAPAICCSTGNG
ncbi:MAG: hypothetical protein ABW072_16765 [Sedimenticola sp.]